ncbi:MAG: secondary thiamine-phosphate synthase enzyme YjbQ [Bdellovibrionota bacterium]|nr:secondary thiamine-phosphate synthase enzyme YjbQ [Bdellovibrionota bacterium]
MRRRKLKKAGILAMQKAIRIQTNGRGLKLITQQLKADLEELSGSGLLNLFVRHTSCSLLIQENADPSAREDLEEFFDRLAPEHQAWHRHTLEGPDDTTSHLKAALTQTSLNIPVVDGQLGLGTWQGIYLFEHRDASHQREIVLTFLKV